MRSEYNSYPERRLTSLEKANYHDQAIFGMSMKGTKRLFFLIICLVKICISTYGQKYNFTNYNKAHGLTHSQVSSLSEDSLNYLWIGTLGGGVNRFDGKQFKGYTTANGLSSNFVNKVLCIPHNKVLVGSRKGLDCIYGDTILHINMPKDQESLTVQDILYHGGNIYVATQRTVFKLQNDSLYPFPLFKNVCSAIINKIAVRQQGIILAATDDGVIEVDLVKQTCKKNLNRVFNNHFNDVLIDSKKNIWFASSGGGITRRNETGQLRVFSKSDGLLGYEANCLFEDSSDKLWIGSQDKGVSLFAGDRFKQITVENGLASNVIYSIYQSSDGAIWFGTGNGLSKFEGEKFVLFDKSSGLPGGGAYSFYQAPDSSLWMGSFAGGVIQKKRENKIHFNAKDGFTSRRVRAFFSDSLGNLWLGTDGDGLFQYNGKTFRDAKIGSKWIRDIIKGDSDTLLLGTLGKGLVKYANGQFIVYGVNKGLNNKRINQLLKHKGRVYLATDSGISFYQNDTIINYSLKSGLPQGRVVSLQVDNHGVIWAGSLGDGLHRLENNKFNSFSIDDGLSSNNIFALFFDKNGHLWVGGENGVDEIILDDESEIDKIKHYGLNEGFFGEEFLKNAIAEDFEGNIWFGTMNGAIRFKRNSEERTKIDELEPKIILEDIQLFYKSIIGQHSNSRNLNYKQNHFTFYFNSSSLSDYKSTSYKWRLIGFSNKWNPESKETFATYSNLSPGKYTFEVKALQNDKESKVSSYSFVINPPYWQTTFFRVLIAITLLAIVSVIIWLIFIQLRKKDKLHREQLEFKNKLLELEQKALRLQMNPHFLFNCLNSIKGVIAESNVKGAKLELSRFAKLMRSMLENSKEANITLEKELQMLSQYMELERLNHGEKFDFNIVTNKIDDKVVIPSMMVQPLVENAILHGIAPLVGEGKIDIYFSIKDKNTLKCMVCDNGIGLKASEDLKNNSTHSQVSSAIAIIKDRLSLLKAKLNNKLLQIIYEPTENIEGNSTGVTVSIYLPILYNV